METERVDSTEQTTEKAVSTIEEKLAGEKPRRLSDLTTDEVAQVFLKIAPDVDAILKDQELKKLWQARKEPTDEGEAQAYGKEFALKAAMHLVANHRNTAYSILGAINGKTNKEIGEQSAIVTIQQVVTLMTDADLYSFFIYATQLAQGGLFK